MAPKLNALRSMTDEQVVEAHDGVAPNTSVGVDYYLDELTRREFLRASEAALAEARSARRLAGVNALVAGVAVIHRLRRAADHERTRGRPALGGAVHRCRRRRAAARDVPPAMTRRINRPRPGQQPIRLAPDRPIWPRDRDGRLVDVSSSTLPSPSSTRMSMVASNPPPVPATSSGSPTAPIRPCRTPLRSVRLLGAW